MANEKCDKCGKPFMSQSGIERHKMYEHPVQVSSFKERSAYGASKDNGDMNMEDLQKMTTNVRNG